MMIAEGSCGIGRLATWQDVVNISKFSQSKPTKQNVKDTAIQSMSFILKANLVCRLEETWAYSSCDILWSQIQGSCTNFLRQGRKSDILMEAQLNNTFAPSSFPDLPLLLSLARRNPEHLDCKDQVRFESSSWAGEDNFLKKEKHQAHNWEPSRMIAWLLVKLLDCRSVQRAFLGRPKWRSWHCRQSCLAQRRKLQKGKQDRW